MDPAITSASEISGIERALDAMRRLAEDSDRGEVNLLDSFLVLDSDPTVSDGDLFLIVPSDAGPRCTNWDTINSVVLYEAHTSAERINAALDLYVAGKADSPLFVSEDLCACIRDLISRITASVPLIGFVTPRFRVIAGDMGSADDLHIGIRGADVDDKTQAQIAYQLLQELRRPFRFLVHQQFIQIEEGDTEATIAGKIPARRIVPLVTSIRMEEAAKVFEVLASLLRKAVRTGRTPRWVNFDEDDPRAIFVGQHGVKATFAPPEGEETDRVLNPSGVLDEDNDEVEDTHL